MNLNPEQKRAVHTVNGKVLILAGAGSGKTGVLAHRTAHLVQNLGVPPSQIVGLTFTNKAAQEMRSRISKLVGKDAAKEIILSTFHSFCMMILRKDITRLGYTSQFTLYDEQDMRRTINQLAKEREEEVDALAIMAARSRGDRLYPPLDDALRAYNAVDFDSLIYLAVDLFEKHPDLLEEYRNRYRYLMIDEYQDTNVIQDRLAHLLAGPRGNLCVVGDEDQSIYGWRGAEVKNILNFPYDTLIKLEQNYRSIPSILQAANGVIRHNKERIGKALWSTQKKTDLVELFHAPTDEEEVTGVIERMLALREEKKLAWSDFAILYRSNSLARAFERGLINTMWKKEGGWIRGIPYAVFGGVELFQRSEVKDLVAYMKTIANPRDQESLLRIVNFPRRGISDQTLDRLTQYNRRIGKPLWEVMKNMDEVDIDITARGRGGIAAFVALIQEAQRRFDESLSEGLKWLIETIDYKTAIADEVKSEKSQEVRLENVDECVHALHYYETTSEESSLVDFVSTTLLDNTRERDRKTFGEHVNLMTFHSAKGLEFPVCFLVGLEDHIIPHERSLLERGLEEERRLMYVALTRCEHYLFLSMARKRKSHGKEVPTNPSRFLFEIPKEVLKMVSHKVEKE